MVVLYERAAGLAVECGGCAMACSARACAVLQRGSTKKTGEVRMNVVHEWKISEEEAAATLGLTEELLRELRADYLYEGEDWGKRGRKICYTEEGVAKLSKMLADRTAACGKACQKTVEAALTAAPDPMAASLILDAVVTKVYETNRMFLEARLGDNIVQVRVRDNLNFIAGMIIDARQLMMRNQQQYDFVGRCPRARGRW